MKRARFVVDIEVGGVDGVAWDDLCDIVRTSLHHAASVELPEDSGLVVEQTATRGDDR